MSQNVTKGFFSAREVASGEAVKSKTRRIWLVMTCHPSVMRPNALKIHSFEKISARHPKETP